MDTPLHHASFRGHLEVVQLLLDRGADVSLSDNFGKTPIQIANKLNYIDIIKLLERE
jgi:ankyrin repeat protein